MLLIQPTATIFIVCQQGLSCRCLRRLSVPASNNKQPLTPPLLLLTHPAAAIEPDLVTLVTQHGKVDTPFVSRSVLLDFHQVII